MAETIRNCCIWICTLLNFQTGFAFTINLWLIGSLFCLYGLYQGIFRSVGKAMAADFVPVQLRASGIGWYSTTIGLTGLIASIVAGQLWDKVSHSSVFIFGAFFSLIGIISLIILIPGKKAKIVARTS